MNESTIADINPHQKPINHNMISSLTQDYSESQKKSSIGFLLTATLIFSGFILSLNLHAAEEIETEETSPSWYEIELVIFSRVEPDPSHNEYWNQYLKLSFPSKLGVLDTNFDPSELSYVEVKEEEKPNANKENAASNKLVPVYPPYTNLEIKSTRLLYAENRLKQSGQFKILSHTRWVQPLTEKESSIPLLFQAGNIYNDLYELEGTILVSVSRYIHIDSNLWLSAFTENQTLLDTWWLEPESNNVQTLVPGFNQSQFTKSNQCSKNFNLLNTQNIKEETKQEQSRDYIITQIAQMKQSRRMRSNEVHYLDHPLFGIIVTVRPYSLPVESIPDDSPILPKSISPLIKP